MATDENKTPAPAKTEATKAEASKAEQPKAEAPKAPSLAEAARAKARAAQAASVEASKEAPKDDLPPSGTGDQELVEVYANDLNKPDDVVAEGDPTGLTEPNAFSSSSDPIAEVYLPDVTTKETQAGVEIRPAKEAAVIVRRAAENGPDRLAATYGVHSGKVGHSVPIVDDYTSNNPRQGGLIGGAGGPGAVGRVKAQQEKDAAARGLMEHLAAGVGAQDRLEVYADDDNDAGKTAYKVIGGSIFTSQGKTVPGQKVMLTSEEAKRFDAIGRLGPWIE